MTNTLRIPLHSFVDLITNSSSETFVAADRQTVSALEDIIDVLLSSVGSDQKCHDLFRIGLDTEDGGYGHYKILYVEARNPKCRLAAKALDQLREAFMPVYQEDAGRHDDRYAIRATENAPHIIEDAINGVLGAEYGVCWSWNECRTTSTSGQHKKSIIHVTSYVIAFSRSPICTRVVVYFLPTTTCFLEVGRLERKYSLSSFKRSSGDGICCNVLHFGGSSRG